MILCLTILLQRRQARHLAPTLLLLLVIVLISCLLESEVAFSRLWSATVFSLLNLNGLKHAVSLTTATCDCVLMRSLQLLLESGVNHLAALYKLS